MLLDVLEVSVVDTIGAGGEGRGESVDADVAEDALIVVEIEEGDVDVPLEYEG